MIDNCDPGWTDRAYLIFVWKNIVELDIHALWLFNVALEKMPIYRLFMIIYMLKMVIFHSHVELPEGNTVYNCIYTHIIEQYRMGCNIIYVYCIYIYIYRTNYKQKFDDIGWYNHTWCSCGYFYGYNRVSRRTEHHFTISLQKGTKLGAQQMPWWKYFVLWEHQIFCIWDLPRRFLFNLLLSCLATVDVIQKIDASG